jgi:hypothetical protein
LGTHGKFWKSISPLVVSFPRTSPLLDFDC